MAQPQSRVQKVLGFSNEEVEGLLKALNLGTTETKAWATVSAMVTDTEWANVDNLRKAMAYQGFDPIKIAEAFLSKATELSPQLKDVVSGETTYKVSSTPHAQTDLLFYLSLFLERGNNLEKIILKSSDEMRATINEKASQYGISIKKTTKVMGPSVIKLYRLAQTFSSVTASIIIGKRVPGKALGKWTGFPTPLLTQHTVFSGLIPVGLPVSQQLTSIAIMLNIETTMLLAPAKEKKKMAMLDMQELVDTSEKYVQAAINGNIVPEPQRIKILRKAEVLTPLDDLTATCQVLANGAEYMMGLKGSTYKVAIVENRAL